MVRFVLFIVILFFFASPVLAEDTDKDIDVLISALIQIESGGDDDAIGDRHLKQKAYGPLQIRQPAIDDYNRWQGTNYKAEDCLGNRKLSVEVCKEYFTRYATKRRLGHEPTDEDRARIWNGGPNGYKKKSTQAYWSKVKQQLKREKEEKE